MLYKRRMGRACLFSRKNGNCWKSVGKGDWFTENLPLGQFKGQVEVYSKVNIFYGSEGEKDKLLKGNYTEVNAPPVWPEHIEVLSTESLKEHLLKNVGARPWSRDIVDGRIISQLNQVLLSLIMKKMSGDILW